MDHDAMQFIFESNLESFRIFFHAICADIDFSHERIIIKREGDDVGVKIVIEMSFVDLKKKVIRTKDKVDSIEFVSFCFNGISYPLDQSLRITRCEINIMRG